MGGCRVGWIWRESCFLNLGMDRIKGRRVPPAEAASRFKNRRSVSQERSIKWTGRLPLSLHGFSNGWWNGGCFILFWLIGDA